MDKRQIIASFLIAYALTPVVISAHEIKTTGPMSVLLHMEPQDSPVVGSEAVLYFATTDAEQRFSTSLCSCSVSIEKDGNTVLDAPLTKQEPTFGPEVFSTRFAFPERGVYTIAFHATPNQSDAFEPFTLQYNVRIERTSIEQNPVNPLKGAYGSDTWIYIVGLLSTLGILVVGFLIKNRRGIKNSTG